MPTPPSQPATLLAGRLDQLAWLRLEGRGDHRIAPAFKRWAQHELKASYEQLVLDLEVCEGLDSTFLGTAATLIFDSQSNGASLELVRADEHVHRILQRMGMTELTQVHTDLGDYEELAGRIDQALIEYRNGRRLSPTERTRFALEAHRQLQEASPENRLRFADVVELLEEELRRHEED